MVRRNAKLPIMLLSVVLLPAAAIQAQSLTITTPATLLPASTAVPYSFQLKAAGGTPPYHWAVVSGFLLPSFFNSGLTLSDSGVIQGQPSGVPSTNTFLARVTDSAGNSAQTTFTLNVYGSLTSLQRTGVLTQIAAGQGWSTAIYLVNATSGSIPGAAHIILRGDNGAALPLSVTSVQMEYSTSTQASDLYYTVPANTTVVITTTAQPSDALSQGWADVYTTVGVQAFAIFRQTNAAGVYSEGTSSQAGQFQSTVVLPFDNTNGFVTSMAIANLTNVPTTVSATSYDQDGNMISSDSLNLDITAHAAFATSTRFPADANKRGTIVFQTVGTSSPIAVLGLRFSGFNTFTSVPAILPPM